MIKFENTEVFNFGGAIRGMRNPHNSWDKSDSFWTFVEDISIINPNDEIKYVIGKNDLELMQRLINAGSDHRKFMRQILVSVDITAPLYWWKEFDTYKVGTVANSCSTMHKLADKEFTVEDFSCKYADKGTMEAIINTLNIYRHYYLTTKNNDYFKAMVELLPNSYNQKRTVTLNYEVLRNIYQSRRKHPLDEWSNYFMYWIDQLPYAKELIEWNISF